MRVAVKVAYDGTRFSGSQVQPGGVRTVHGEVASALRNMGHVDRELRWAGRTDAGVSAAGNVVVFETHVSPASLLPGLSFRMEDAWAWAWAEVDAAFEPRHARRRRYRYHLRTDADAGAIDTALRLFVGTHDFRGFAKLEEGVNPVRTVYATSATRDGPFVVINIVGESFLWNQVRRMVAASQRVAEGKAAAREVEDVLAKGSAADFGTAPPEPLLLAEVEYDGLVFHEARDRAFERHQRRLEEAELRVRMLQAMRG